ncbi:hypothetical protein [Parerythrobacter lacustris]|uniref:Uncharacterized protein n=1 Tax=Parerythrobacter lacustris TaxID=2969984 RepID=A0ABT1XVV2_9SPHN|nr:hypothetical protein [Parerythrobacter lacustris]MCR2834557.1 hypothetical protein [Parerythrobacter lacustris]
MEIESDKHSLTLKLDLTEFSHLVSFLMHAKFSADVDESVAGSPTMRALLENLLAATEGMEGASWLKASSSLYLVDENERGTQAPASFEILEHIARSETELENYLFPYRWLKRPAPRSRAIEVGRIVETIGPRHSQAQRGVWIDQWVNLDNGKVTVLVAWTQEHGVDEAPTTHAVIEQHDSSELKIIG